MSEGDSSSRFDDSEFDANRKTAIQSLARDDVRSFWVQVVRDGDDGDSDPDLHATCAFKNEAVATEDMDILIAHHIAQFADVSIEEYVSYLQGLVEQGRDEQEW